MPNTETLLTAWGLWSRVEINAGPDDVGCGSAEHAYRSPQPWDDDTRRRARLVVICDEEAMRIEHAVIRCGPVLAASLRAYFIFQRAPRRRMEVEYLRFAVRRVGELLEAPQEARNRPRIDAADGHAMSTPPQPL